MSTALKEQILRLVEEDKEFRLALAGAIGLAEVIEDLRELRRELSGHSRALVALQEQVVEHSRAIRDLQEQVKALQEQVKTLQEQVKVLQEHMRALQEDVKALQEQVVEHSRVVSSMQLQVAELAEAVRELSTTVAAVGNRWGLLAEESFRKAMREIVERLVGGKVERWVYHDEEGIVFGRPSVVEVVFVVRNGEHILVEVKSSASTGDVYELLAVGRLYEKVRKVKPRLVLVSPYVHPKAQKLAEELGIIVHAGTF